MSALEPAVDVSLVAPISGDVLTLSSQTSDLARWLSEVRDWEADLRQTKRAVTVELCSRMDQTAKWTQTAGDFKLSADSPAPTESWNGADLYSALSELVDRGVISVDALNAAIEVEIVHKPRKAGINQLRKLGGQVAEVITGLRQAADFLEAHPDLPKMHAWLSNWVYGKEARQVLTQFADALPEPVESMSNGSDVKVGQQFGAVEVYAQASTKDLGATAVPVVPQYEPILAAKAQVA